MNKIRTLVVDDKESHRRFIADVLRSEGYEVLEAANGEQARRKLREEQPVHLLVLDQMMPRLTGTTFWRQIKADETFKDVWDLPVIFITAYPEDDEMRDLKAKGVPVLAKPLRDYQDILDAVRQVLG
jgi:CheY-like chemotaxis protein